MILDVIEKKDVEKVVGQLEALCAAAKKLVGANGVTRPRVRPTMTIRHSGFRPAVREVLERAGKPLSAHEVVEALEKAHVKVGGATPLSVRVTNELSRMKGMNVVAKTAEGFVLNQEAATQH